MLVSVNVSLLETPKSSFVMDGGDVTLTCHSNLSDPIRWLYIRSENTPQDVLFNGKSIDLKYVDRVTAQVSGGYTLLLHDVQLNQMGLYICINDGGNSYKYPIQLTVLGKQLFLNDSLVLTKTFKPGKRKEDDCIPTWGGNGRIGREEGEEGRRPLCHQWGRVWEI